MPWLSLLSILFLLAVHLSVGYLRLSRIPRSRWLSLAGGISVTYIFLHVLPEFAVYQDVLAESTRLKWMADLEHHIYSFALLGLVAFYAMERAAKRARDTHRDPEGDHDRHGVRIFWVHIASFVLYNGIIGYLIVWREDQTTLGLLYYVVAMAFHFIVTDYALYDHYQELYRTRGRWLVVTALVVGWVLGLVVEIPEVFIGMIFSFLAGGVIMNVLKEELPGERQSNIRAFVVGVIAYALLLLAT
ncbi:hypothetical protein CLV84_0892 [Neolewinella xylanilytica]|uniref:ZIP Zinc transporter n=1 Tax=Neolewinella xylanilytica TaxID=1514080 RepID=A0A2S6I8W5_9BACT|nr:hypothetical protein [Neolewinella xylanilytica]PPK87933.1 hypothetical protein CLV84_0892 [Neolewinella xylanilytica]